MDEDAAALGVQKPDHEPRATEYIAADARHDRRARVERARVPGRERRRVLPGARSFPGYGKLSGKSLDELRAGERVEVDREKQDPLDFVLWKHSKRGRAGVAIAVGATAGPAGTSSARR